MDNVLVEAFAGEFLYESTDHIEVQVAVLVAFAGSIVIVAVCPVGIGLRINGIKGKIALTVIQTGGVGKQYLYTEQSGWWQFHFH